MSAPRFVHLRLHSEFSITDGLTRIDSVVEKAARDGMGALALTDLSNLFGMVKFYQAARGKGVKPIIGADVWISNQADRDKPSRALLLVTSNAGYLLLCRLLTRAWLTNQHRGRAEIDKAWFKESTLGLIALSGMLVGPGAGDIAQALEAGKADHAETLAHQWAALFPKRFYIEVQRDRTLHTEAPLLRGDDGLFRGADGDLQADPAARVQSGALEGSNVSPVESMVAMIAAARQFEQQMKMLQTSQEREQAATKLLSSA